jgi:hypothetical protein
MKQVKKVIPFLIVIIVVMLIGYFMREDMIYYNYGDTYYVLDYFIVSLLVSLLIVILTLIVFVIKKILTKK